MRSVSGNTNINTAPTTALQQRDKFQAHCSVIVLTDDLDWGVTNAMKTAAAHVEEASKSSKLLRGFVEGLDDDVSRGTCEALARPGP